MGEKRRIPFTVLDDNGTKWASGDLYDEGNIQVLWRIDIGWCGQQYSSISYAFTLFTTAKTVKLHM